MSIKAKSTAFAIATASSVLSFSVPSQAGEYEYLYELETMVEQFSQQEGVNQYSDKLSDSKKFKYGKWHCDFVEHESINDIYGALKETTQDMSQQGYSDRQIKDFMTFEISAFYASVKEICPEYKHKFYNFIDKFMLGKSAKEQGGFL
jgi:hypothetical protein